MIKHVFPGTIDASTVMILVNAMFFNGTWAQMFPAINTHRKNFHTLCGSTSEVMVTLSVSDPVGHGFLILDEGL